VRLLRWLLPSLAVAAVLVVIVGWMVSSISLPDVTVTDVSITEDGIAMDAPVLRGQDQDGRPYELRAQEAFQTVSANPVITMHGLEGEMAIDDSERVFITAPQARFDSETGIMVFEEGGVVVTLSSGGQAQLGVSAVDLENGALRSDEPAAIANDEVRLNSGGVQGFDGGRRLLFTGGVRMVFTPAAREPQEGTQ
jgi:lipopolysaccharide export system protein LptC